MIGASEHTKTIGELSVQAQLARNEAYAALAPLESAINDGYCSVVTTKQQSDSSHEADPWHYKEPEDDARSDISDSINHGSDDEAEITIRDQNQPPFPASDLNSHPGNSAKPCSSEVSIERQSGLATLVNTTSHSPSSAVEIQRAALMENIVTHHHHSDDAAEIEIIEHLNSRKVDVKETVSILEEEKQPAGAAPDRRKTAREKDNEKRNRTLAAQESSFMSGIHVRM
jgi:hypothetical protein